MHRKRHKELGLVELIAIALGGMVGGGIFTVLGISVELIGGWTPVAIILGGVIAAFAAYSYVKLGVYYKNEGATYAFFKLSYPSSPFAAAVIGWFVIFGYISTLALYAYTFSSYALSSSSFADDVFMRKAVAIAIIIAFAAINVWSVNGMGKLEDIMVYTKLIVLLFISAVLVRSSEIGVGEFVSSVGSELNLSTIEGIFIVAAVTFVAYEGFQLVINAVNEMSEPEKNIPRAIYSAIGIAIAIYVIIALGALLAIPVDDIIANKEYALAAGAGSVLGSYGIWLVIAGALLASSSAISGTIFGASRQMAVIAEDEFFPKTLAIRKGGHTPQHAVFVMAAIASVLVAVGGLQLILEFGSITFLLVSLLMAITNFRIREHTQSSTFLTVLSIVGLGLGTVCILYYELVNAWGQMVSIVVLYVLLAAGAWMYSKSHNGFEHLAREHTSK